MRISRDSLPLLEIPPPLSEVMDLYKKYCLEEGCRTNSALLEYMKSNAVLQQITLANNYVGPKGLRPVIRLLNRCQTITLVDFDSNGADNSTLEILCDVLRDHIGVTALILRGNPISSSGGKRLLQLLELNPRITHIDVRDTDIPEALQGRIAVLADQNLSRSQHHAPQLVEASHTIQKSLSREAAGPAQKNNAASLPPLPHRVWKAADASTPIPKTTVKAAAQLSTKDNSYAPAATLPLAGLPKQQPQLPDFASPAVGVTPPATNASLKIPGTPLKIIHQRFHERRRLFSDLNQSEMRKVVAEVRAEVAAVERNRQRNPAGNMKWSVLQQTLCQKTSETDMKPEDTAQVMDVAAEEHRREGNATSAAPDSFPKLPGSEPVTKADSVELLKEDAATNDQTNDSRVSEAATVEKKDTIEGLAPRCVDSTRLRVVPARDLNGGALATDTTIEKPTDEKFQILFDSGCDAYARKDLDAAYVTWNDALGIAVGKGNREWIAVLSSNLQRLSYELAVEEGAGYLSNGFFTKATNSFETALGIARKAHNAAWVAEMKKALKHVQNALFTRYYEAGNELFRQAQQDCEISKHTNFEDIHNDKAYYVNPLTKQKVRHSERFLQEWDTVRLVRDAVGTWAEAYRAAQRVSGADADPLKADIEKALDGVAKFVFEQHIDVEEGETGLDASCPSWQQTSRYQHMERAMLADVWFDILCCVDQGIGHVFMKVVVSHQLANLYIGTNQLEQAEKLLTAAVEGSKKLRHELLEATSLTYLATLYWLRAAHGLAEGVLHNAIQHWESILTACRGGDALSALGGISVSIFSVLLMQSACNGYLVCVLAATHRYCEALEQLEHTLIHESSDLLMDKMLGAFCGRPSLDQIAAIASRARTPFVYYFPARSLSYNTETNAFDVEENLFVWLVMPCAEMRFVKINITKNFHVSIEQAVRDARQGLLVEPIGQECLAGHQKEEDYYANTATGIITTLHRKAWIEPLQTLHEMLMEPIYHHIMALDLAVANMEHSATVLTIIPTGALWKVPFHALLSKTEQFLVESIAIQLSFSATQVAFASLNEGRGRQRELHHNTAVVPLEIAAATEGVSLLYPLDIERALEEGETVLRVFKDAKWKHVKVTSEDKDPTEVTMVGTEVMVRDAETLRSALNHSCILHITAPISATPANLSDAMAERCAELTPKGALYLPTDTGCAELVTAQELQHSDIFAELVTLSNANMSPAGVRSDALGVVRSFFSAGAPCVIVGQWCTPDMIPSMLFKKFYEVLAENTKPGCVIAPKAKKSAAAVSTVAVHKAVYLAMAIRHLLEEDESFRYNPRAWAGYYCFGCGYF